MQTWYAMEGYYASDNLSDELRMALQPLMRFRQHCHIEDAVGKNKGELFTWNIYSKVKEKGGKLNEREAMPETSFDVTQGTMEIDERGNSIPYTGKLDDLSKHPIKTIIHQVVKDDANEVMEEAAHSEWDKTLLTVAPTSGTSETAITVENSGCTITNNVNLRFAHVKLIVDEMKERNIPTIDGTNYGNISRPTTLRPLKDDLEAVSKYVDSGYGKILNGEQGRAEGVRFFEQTAIASEGWTNGKSDASYFFGSDTVAEGIAVAEEIRGKIPSDYGRSKGVAWYALNGFAIVHNQTGAAQNRIVKWDSAG